MEPAGDARPYPLTPRLFAGGLALLGGLYFGAAVPGRLAAGGHPLTAAAMAATVAPFVLLFALFALAPATLEAPARCWTRLDLREGAHMGSALVIATTLWAALGYGALVGGVSAYETEVVRGETPAELSGEGILAGLVFNAILLVLPVLLYVGFVRDPTTRGPFDALGLRWEGLPRALGLGAATAIGMIVALSVVGYGLQAAGQEMDENERALEIARGVTILGALAVAVGSSVTEEIFFRGFLQPRIGVLAQAVLFGLAHLAYLHILQIVVTFALGLVFGILYRRTGNLWAPIAGHFTFNLVMLLVAQTLPTTPA